MKCQCKKKNDECSIITTKTEKGTEELNEYNKNYGEIKNYTLNIIKRTQKLKKKCNNMDKRKTKKNNNKQSKLNKLSSLDKFNYFFII